MRCAGPSSELTKRRMSKRQSETEPATKTVAEVAHAAGGVRQWFASNGSLAARNMAPGPSCYPVGAHARSPVLYCPPLMWQPENLGIIGISASRCYGATLCARKPLESLGFSEREAQEPSIGIRHPHRLRGP